MERVVAGRPAAVIFDMDGVLADTEPIQEEALAAFLAARGKSLRSDDYTETIGLDYRSFWAEMIVRYELAESVAECVAAYEPILLGRLVDLPPAPGAAELVRSLEALHVLLAVASSSFLPVVEATLGAIGLRDAFGVVVSGEQVMEGKPAPDIYLRAAQRLGVEPGKCVAIEDSANGVRAARAAGMACLGIVTAYSTREQLSATRAVESLAEVTPADLAAMASATL